MIAGMLCAGKRHVVSLCVFISCFFVLNELLSGMLAPVLNILETILIINKSWLVLQTAHYC